MSTDPKKHVGLEGRLVLSGHRVAVQVGEHEVIHLDVVLRDLAGKKVIILVDENEKP